MLMAYNAVVASYVHLKFLVGASRQNEKDRMFARNDWWEYNVVFSWRYQV